MLETRSAALNAANVDAFRQGMRELGYKQDQNLEIVYRSSDGRDERFPALADELVHLKVDLILTRGTPAALAAKRATGSIPVVMAASGDPVGSHIVTSLARPGANVTGLSSGITESFPKRVQLLAELLPGLKRIVALLNMGNPVVPPQWDVVEASAHSLGIEPHLLDVRRPEDLQGHSMKQRNGVPRHSWWDSMVSRRRICAPSPNWRQSSGCPRFIRLRTMRSSEG